MKDDKGGGKKPGGKPVTEGDGGSGNKGGK